MSVRRSLVPMLALALLAAGCSSTVTLRNGGQVSGALLEGSDDALLLESEDGSHVPVPRAEIVDVDHASADAAIAFGALFAVGLGVEVASIAYLDRNRCSDAAACDNPALLGLAIVGAGMAFTGLIGGAVATGIYLDDLSTAAGWGQSWWVAPWLDPADGAVAAGAGAGLRF